MVLRYVKVKTPIWSPKGKAPRGALRPPAGAYGACGAGFFFFFSRSHPGKIAAFFYFIFRSSCSFAISASRKAEPPLSILEPPPLPGK